MDACTLAHHVHVWQSRWLSQSQDSHAVIYSESQGWQVSSHGPYLLLTNLHRQLQLVRRT